MQFVRRAERSSKGDLGPRFRETLDDEGKPEAELLAWTELVKSCLKARSSHTTINADDWAAPIPPDTPGNYTATAFSSNCTGLM